jgi:hypothetical protein
MRLHAICCYFGFIGIAANVQTVNAAVSGTVSNLAGKPIAGAIVSLREQGTRDTTDLNGSFSLATTDVTVSPFVRPQRTAITVQGNSVNFSLSSPSPVTIELFNAQGALLKKASLRNAQIGCYRFTIAENSYAADLIVIRVSVGRNRTTFRRLWLQSGSRAPAPISIAGGKAPNSLTPWVTSASDNLKSGDAITLSGGTFTAQLDAKTVTTFVGR